MPQKAHVTSLDALEAFRSDLIVYLSQARPALDEIGADQAGKLRIGKINIDENLELARRFDVMSIPTMILFKDGEPQLRIIGAKGKGQLLQELHPYL